MEAISKPFFEVPDGVNHTVDRPGNVISHSRNSEREFPNRGELREQAFSLQEPIWIRAAGRARVAVARSPRANMA